MTPKRSSCKLKKGNNYHGKVITVKYVPATGKKGKRSLAQSESARVEEPWDYELTDAANYRKAANRVVFEMNSEPANVVHGIRYTIVASGLMPDGKCWVFIAED